MEGVCRRRPRPKGDVEFAGEPLAHYEVEYSPRTDCLREVKRPRLFSRRFVPAQPRLFEFDAVGEGGWLRVVRLERYAPMSPRRPQVLQQSLFPYATAL